MLEFLTAGPEDAINILKTDHHNVKELFDRFEKAETRREKMQISTQAINELKVHAAIEEGIFYPALRPELKDSLMNEADEEHHVAKVLIAELSEMDGSEDHYDAKFHVLSENIRHHIREEEGKMMPEARGLDVDFDALGAQLLERKKELKKTGVPECDEERMVAMAGISDSPARAAHSGKKAKPRKLAAKRSAPLKSTRGAKVVKLSKSAKKRGKTHKSAVAMKSKRTGQRATRRA